MKKRALTLMEMVVTIGLLALFLSSLLSWTYTVSKKSRLIDARMWPYLEERFAEQRLGAIFDNYLPETPCATGPLHSLIICFDRGIFPNPDLSNKVMGKIYFTPKERTLNLDIWPLPERENRVSHQTITLLENVDAISWELFAAPDLRKLTVKPDEVDKPHPTTGWQTTWNIDYESHPDLVKLHVSRGDREMEFAFDLSQKILYPMSPE